MAITKNVKDLRGFSNDKSIKVHYSVPYTLGSVNRYKHIEELLLDDDKVIKATLGLIDLSIFPFEGVTLHTVANHEENRIDIIANKYYNSASLYWVLCYINNIADPLVLPINKILVIPSIESLRQFPNPLS